MTPNFNKIHNRFKFNGIHFSHSELKEVAYSLVKEGELYDKVTGEFLLDWLSDDHFLFVKTSGSTGKPKQIKISKQAMVNSAIATGDFFRLKPGDKALGCLPSHYIAGKMMLVRAMVLGLEIDCVEPSSCPVFNYDTSYDFCAMIPLQVLNTIRNTVNIKTIIIGGAKVTKPLLSIIVKSNSFFYETYGMTETVTHVALKQLPSQSAEGENKFNALPNVSFKQDQRGCLVINAHNIVEGELVTNDIVALKSETSFEWLGRFDNVINSGGVKLFPEQIEEKLQSKIKERFIVASEFDEVLGEKLILIIESPLSSITSLLEQIKSLNSLTKFEVPKKIYATNKFIETLNGKIQRKQTIASILK